MSKCNTKCEVYSRVCGYFRPVSNWNKGKKEEFKDRRTFDVRAVMEQRAKAFVVEALENERTEK